MPRQPFNIEQFSIACVVANNSTFLLWQASLRAERNTQKCKVFAIVRLYDEQGNETEMVVMKVESHILGIWVESGRFHSLEAMDENGDF